MPRSESDFDTPDGSHPIYYAAAHAYEGAVRATIAANFAADQGELDEGTHLEWAELMLEQFICLDQAWIQLRRARLHYLGLENLPDEQVRDELEHIEELEEALDVEDARDWEEIIRQAHDADQADHVLRRGLPRLDDD